MTSGVKVGQKVRIEIPEAVVRRVDVDASRPYPALTVTFHVPDGSDVIYELPTDWVVEVLPEPLKIGDDLLLGSDPEPPIGTVLVTVQGYPMRRVGSCWANIHGEQHPWSKLNSTMPARVVWLPGNQT